MSNYVVGDVQGCFDELLEGLEKIKFNSSKDFLWLTGDLINKGPKSREVLNFIYKKRDSMHVVLGNHDLHFLNCYFNGIKPQREDTIDSLLKDKNIQSLSKFLLKQPFVFSKGVLIKNKVIKVGMIHAGIPRYVSLKELEIYSKRISQKLVSKPKKTLEKIFKQGDQNNYNQLNILRFLTTARTIDKNGKPNYSYKGNKKNLPTNLNPWFEVKMRAMEDLDLLVFGHWAALRGKTNIFNIKALDTGCCWGKELTFLRLEDNKKFKVKSKQK